MVASFLTSVYLYFLPPDLDKIFGMGTDDIPDSFNSILFATKQPGSWENFVLNFGMLGEMNVEPLLLEAMEMTINHQQSPSKTTQVYTDDRAPIEWITNKIVVDFILSGEMEGRQ